MSFKNIFFNQENREKLSDFQIIDFVNTLLSINYKIEFINGLTNTINDEKIELENLVLFSNPNKKYFENYKVNLSNEAFSEYLISNGNFLSFYPNILINDYRIISYYFSHFRKIFFGIDEEFKRDWSLNKAIKLYNIGVNKTEDVEINIYDDSFNKTINYLKTFFIKEALKYNIPELVKSIEDKTAETFERRKSYKELHILFNNNEEEQTNQKRKYISDVISLIHINEFPQVYYFNTNEYYIENYDFNNFMDYDNFALKSISHESPWSILSLIKVGAIVYTFYIGYLKLQNYRVNIQKNKKDIQKTDIELADKKNAKVIKLIDEINKSNSDLKNITDNIEKIKDPFIKSELLNELENCVYKLQFYTKKYRISITLDDLKTSLQ